MTLDEAIKIVHAINSFCLAQMGLGETDVKTVEPLSLVDMLEAKRLVIERNDAERAKDGAHTIYMYPDDRLIAAVYSLLHYRSGMMSDKHDDEILVTVKGNWNKVFFLAVGARDASEMADEDDEEEAA